MTAADTFSPEALRSAVVRYLDAVASGDPAAIGALYAPDATLEDPVGSEPRQGREAITEFYGAIANAKVTYELFTLRAAGNSAAFHFRIATEAGGRTFVVEPIETMTFDADGLITSMRAYWAPGDMQQG
ncbi:nuclear transport factor 2 family protein [Rhodococcus sp. HNM0569]|uniref:nuclear transport factor 2 family protein n=1 Tax=Rhodococcus sp. HNM0569 TaxID=2716340 RepID=UPI00146C4C9F|nr:nuclear transport factor 2 family protein [Rhodococcus sp. HNM0569]NLU83267.1 SnoaL-like domain-containing protein [Rhodococcus sp. HNM0569]